MVIFQTYVFYQRVFETTLQQETIFTFLPSGHQLLLLDHFVVANELAQIISGDYHDLTAISLEIMVDEEIIPYHGFNWG